MLNRYHSYDEICKLEQKEHREKVSCLGYVAISEMTRNATCVTMETVNIEC